MNKNNYDEAIKKLFPRKKNFVKNSLCVNNIDNMNEIGPFIHCSYKRSQLKFANFINSDMHNSAWTDSNFYAVNLINCNLNSANLQLCVFDNCTFKNIDYIYGASLNHGYYKNVTFENIEFKNCIFADAIFINCNFKNCKFKSSSFDGTKFILCDFDNLIARNLNMDFSQYRDCRFYNSQISLFQCAYTIGLLQVLNKKENNNVFAFQGTNLSPELFYNEYINYLTVYFNEQCEYFPIANIELYKGNTDYGKTLIEMGIKNSIQNQKYRLVLHYCELINYYNCFKSVEKRNLLQYINLCIASIQGDENISEALRYSVIIEHTLLNSYDNRRVYYISLQTDLIEQSNDNNVTSFITDLDKLLSTYQGESGEHNITVTHNSPLWLDIVLALGCGVAANYLKNGIDFLIRKIRKYAKDRKTKVKNITVKAVDPVEGKIDSDGNDEEN